MEEIRSGEKSVPFEKFLGRDVKILQIMGMHSMNLVFTGEEKKAWIWESIFFYFAIVNLALGVLFEYRAVFEHLGGDVESTIVAVSVVISGTICTSKGLIIWLHRDNIRKLLRSFAVMWEDPSLRVGIRKESIQMAAQTHYIVKLNIIMVTVLCMSYAFRPYILLLDYHLLRKGTNYSEEYIVTVYPSSYPWSTGTVSKHVMCVSWEQFITIFVAIYWIVSDTMFAQLTTHAAIQFRALWQDLEHVANAEESNEFHRESEKKLIDRLSAIAGRHRDLYTHCELIQRIFNPILFLTLLVTAMSMCVCTYHLQTEIMRHNWEEALKMVFHSITVVIQASIYCVYGHRLTQQSNMVADAAYRCQWVERSKTFKIVLQVILMRAQKPFDYTAYGFFSVNLSQMTTIFKTAGSYFTLIQSFT